MPITEALTAICTALIAAIIRYFERKKILSEKKE